MAEESKRRIFHDIYGIQTSESTRSFNETGHVHSFTYHLWLLLCYKNRVVVTETV